MPAGTWLCAVDPDPHARCDRRTVICHMRPTIHALEPKRDTTSAPAEGSDARSDLARRSLTSRAHAANDLRRAARAFRSGVSDTTPRRCPPSCCLCEDRAIRLPSLLRVAPATTRQCSRSVRRPFEQAPCRLARSPFDVRFHASPSSPLAARSLAHPSLDPAEFRASAARVPLSVPRATCPLRGARRAARPCPRAPPPELTAPPPTGDACAARADTNPGPCPPASRPPQVVSDRPLGAAVARPRQPLARPL